MVILGNGIRERILKLMFLYTFTLVKWHNEIGKLKNSIKICLLLFSLLLFLLGLDPHPTLHMPCSANNVCPPCKGQGVQDFSRTDNIQERTRWEWLEESTICVFQTTSTRHLDAKTPLSSSTRAPSNNTWVLVFVLTGSWLPERTHTPHRYPQ